MADTSVFERARMTQEEIEQLEDALVDTLNHAPKTTAHRLHLQWQLATSSLLDEMASRYAVLKDLYADTTGELAQEWDALGRIDDGDAEAGPFAEFYERLEHLHRYYQKYPARGIALVTSATPSMLGLEDTSLFDMTELERKFSGEEMGGRFLDLYTSYEQYINLKDVTHISYLEYLATLDDMVGTSSQVPLAARRSEAYRTYLHDLCAYLLSFLHKTRPLDDIDALEARILSEFDGAWDDGRVPGWEAKEAVLFGASDAAPSEALWCAACRRSYAKQTVYDAHLTSQKHARAVARAAEAKDTPPAPAPSAADNAAHAAAEHAKRLAKSRAIARDEVLAQALARELTSVRNDTRANVERKAALTEREREEEVEALDAEMDEAVATGGVGYDTAAEDENAGVSDKIYNPLKLPIGWDGKPIPFWMYKLHGLRVEYRCEICSNHVYKGRKVFEKHFQESRHAFGMRALGLPNTPEFRDVTRIQDALALAEKLRQLERQATVDEDDTIEVEDEHGNVRMSLALLTPGVYPQDVRSAQAAGPLVVP